MRRKTRNSFKSLNKELQMYGSMVNRPPMGLQKRGLAYIDQLIKKQGLHKFHAFETEHRYLGRRDQLNEYLFDSWINKWDVRKTIKKVRGRKFTPTEEILLKRKKAPKPKRKRKQATLFSFPNSIWKVKKK